MTNEEKNALDEAVERIRCAIRYDMRAGRVPFTVKSLEALGKHTNINTYFDHGADHPVSPFSLREAIDDWLARCTMEDKREGADMYHAPPPFPARPVRADQPEPDEDPEQERA